MDHKTAQERFEALSKLVDDLHSMVKDPIKTKETLVDRYFRMVGLAKAFDDDCTDYKKFVKTEPPAVEVMVLVHGICVLLNCTVLHLQDAASDLGTDILEKLTDQADNQDNKMAN